MNKEEDEELPRKVSNRYDNHSKEDYDSREDCPE